MSEGEILKNVVLNMKAFLPTQSKFPTHLCDLCNSFKAHAVSDFAHVSTDASIALNETRINANMND